MTILNPALNYNFASAEAQRLAAADRGAEEVVANQLRQAAEVGKFTVGSTITARYQYKVAEDGGLIPVQTQITTDAPNADKLPFATGRRSRQAFRRDEQERPPTFADLAKPKPELSPMDELSLFAKVAAGEEPPVLTPPTTFKFTSQTAAVSVLKPATTEVSDENGDTIEAELLTPDGEKLLVRNEALLGNFAARAQFSVASLYARNHEIQYQITPIAQLAA